MGLDTKLNVEAHRIAIYSKMVLKKYYRGAFFCDTTVAFATLLNIGRTQEAASNVLDN